jgi:hypothetical protein
LNPVAVSEWKAALLPLAWHDAICVETDLGVDPTAVDISPDGTRLAVGTATGKSRWDTRGRSTGRPRLVEVTEAAARTVESVVEPVDPEAGRRRTSRISPNLTS